ncbi:MAG: hypothetical protein WC539_07530 [Nitrospirota bacterium]
MAEVKKLGVILKEAGLIDEFQLQSALAHQRTWGGKLGSILIEMEMVMEEDMLKVMSNQLRIPHVNLFEPEIPESIVKLIKPEIARKYQIIPVKKEGGALVLAMFDPLDIEAMDEIRFITGMNIRPSLALESEIKDAIRKYYDGVPIDRSIDQKFFHHRNDYVDSELEIMRGNDFHPVPVPLREVETPHVSDDTNTRLDALISILLEKKLISYEELVGRIHRKKGP